jgi:hypothetical protein
MLLLFSIVYDPQNTDNQTTPKLAGLEKSKSVGVVRGDYRADILRNHGVKNVVEYNSWKQAIGAVLKGKVSSILYSELGVSVTYKLAKFDCSSLMQNISLLPQHHGKLRCKNSNGEPNYLFFSDGVIDIICLTIERSCTDITRVFQFQLATTYLAVSKLGTPPQLV